MSATTFRPEIEGLRGVAVLLVIASHAGLPIPGAAVGPDLFFVLSGYLIIGLLLRRIEQLGRLDFGAFYARRLRRLVPAAVVTIALTVGAVALSGDPFALERVAVDGAAALAGVGNLHFALGLQDYFASSAPSPLLPLWSIGVEEQFCLLVPLAVSAAYALGRRPIVGLLLLLIATGSTVAAVVLTASDPVWAYYLLPTRAYALAIGGLLAIAEARLLRSWLRRLPLGTIGALLLGLILLLVPGEQGWPGAIGPVAAVAAALLIGGASRAMAGGRFIVALLSLPPLRGIGRISYSLFLLHFPFLIVPTIYGVTMTPLLNGLAVIGATIGALVLYHLVEQPFRRGRLVGETPRSILPRIGSTIAIAVALLLTVGLLPGEIAVATSSPSRAPFPTTAPVTPSPGSPTPTPSAPLEEWQPIRIDGTAEHLLAGPLPASIADNLRAAERDGDDVLRSGCGIADAGTRAITCAYGRAGGPRIAIVGTSHAAHWVPALELIAAEAGYELNPYVKANCPFVDYEVESARLGRTFHECTAWREDVIATLTATPPALIIVASSRHSDPSGRANTLERSADAVYAMIRRLPGPVVIFADNPYGQTDIPSCLARHRDDVAACAVARRATVYNWATARDLRVGEKYDLPVFDFTPSLCPGTRCAAVIDGIVVYHDHHHLTTTMSRHLAPAIAPHLVPLLAVAP